MNKSFYTVAVDACANVYKKNIELDMSTEYSYAIKTINGKRYQVIAVAGTDDLMDMFKNLNLLSRDGIKLSAYNAAKRIMKDVKLLCNMPVIVTGHSMGGIVAIALKRMYKFIKYCIAFAPARGLRYWSNRKMKNTVIFTDPDDAVSEWLAILSFGLPKCKKFEGEDDHILISASDHKIEKWRRFVSKMVD